MKIVDIARIILKNYVKLILILHLESKGLFDINKINTLIINSLILYLKYNFYILRKILYNSYLFDIIFIFLNIFIFIF